MVLEIKIKIIILIMLLLLCTIGVLIFIGIVLWQYVANEFHNIPKPSDRINNLTEIAQKILKKIGKCWAKVSSFLLHIWDGFDDLREYLYIAWGKFCTFIKKLSVAFLDVVKSIGKLMFSGTYIFKGFSEHASTYDRPYKPNARWIVYIGSLILIILVCSSVIYYYNLTDLLPTVIHFETYLSHSNNILQNAMEVIINYGIVLLIILLPAMLLMLCIL